MAESSLSTPVWPEQLGPNDDMYAVVDSEVDNTLYLVLSSEEKGATLVRDNGAWFKVGADFYEDIDDPKNYIEYVDVDFIKYFDKLQAAGKPIPSLMVDEYSIEEDEKEEPITAAVDANECPPATQDVAINIQNRAKAIETADYGPLNPAEENIDYWVKIGDLWNVSASEAKKSTCGNCVFFYMTTQMRECIAKGINDENTVDDPWDSIEAGDLGYCEAFDFKCASSRTCVAWATGGPITDDKQQDSQEEGVSE